MDVFDRSKALQAAIEYRTRSIAERQLDIDNYKVSLEIIDTEYANNADMVGYKKQLEDLLHSAIVEMTKEQIFLVAAQTNLRRMNPIPDDYADNKWWPAQ